MSPFISYNQSFKKKYSSIISDWTYILLCLMTFGTNFVTISLSDVCLLEVICQTIYSFCDSGDILRISMSLIILFSNTDYHLLKGKLFRASGVLISNWADSRLEDIWRQNKFCLKCERPSRWTQRWRRSVQVPASLPPKSSSTTGRTTIGELSRWIIMAIIMKDKGRQKQENKWFWQCFKYK